ncbi:hypothetical protein NQ317_001357 [Molorchus minor]|uniref:Uncharacterized protein n=1 Tax=Molorchus minor TaxID=1323400 RepID=A0ABQ9JNL7_9CUCU|nr:hypothetical protein NQ317_001357 [Molorchus minor]
MVLGVLNPVVWYTEGSVAQLVKASARKQEIVGSIPWQRLANFSLAQISPWKAAKVSGIKICRDFTGLPGNLLFQNLEILL